MAEPMGLTASDIVFSEATPEQRQLAWELSAEAWAAPMSLADYVEREQHLAQQELCRDGRCRYWVLYLKGYPRQIIASCESTRKPVLISVGRGEPAREGHGYAVTNIYTNPCYRRQGMAAFLLRRVKEQMDADSDCSVLFSDSGRNYYASLGWYPFASAQATMTLLPSSNVAPSNTLTRPLQLSDLPDLCDIDCLQLTKRFESLPADDTKTRIAFLPTFAQIAWHLARAEIDARKLLPDRAKSNSSNGNGNGNDDHLAVPLPKGAITADSRAWIYWSHDWREKRLRVLRIVELAARDGRRSAAEQRARDAAALLEAAVVEARARGLSKVVVWNPDEEVRLGCKGVGNALPDAVKVVFEQLLEVGIPSLRWSGGRHVKGTVWEENYGHCWC